MKSVIVVLLSIMVAVPAIAGPPVNGTYTSTDIGGSMLPGRYTESWNPGKLTAGNTLNEESWNGATLGTQWRWYCPQTVSTALLVNTVNGIGNGIKIWRVTYAGGYVWLDGPTGPWDGGDASYTANVDSWVAIVTETYQSFVEVGSIRNHNARATFIGYTSECINLAISNLEKLGPYASNPTYPANFPGFMDASCALTGNTGEWGDVDSITFTVNGCETVSVQQSSWGSVKALYKK